MDYKVKKQILNILLLPIFAMSRKLGFYLRGILIQNLYTKIRAIKAHFPKFSYWHSKLMSGGANFCFLVKDKYIIKIKKNYTDKIPEDLAREKKITDASRQTVQELKIQVPKLELFHAFGYAFSKYDLIRGVNLNKIPIQKIIKNRKKIAKQIADFIRKIHAINIFHNDISNNILIDPKTMNITGILDWEFATIGGKKENEFINMQKRSKKFRKSNLISTIKSEYFKEQKK